MVDCVISIIRDASDEMLGRVAAGPLWELMECRDNAALTVLEQSLGRNERLGRSVVAIPRYSRKVGEIAGDVVPTYRMQRSCERASAHGA